MKKKVSVGTALIITVLIFIVVLVLTRLFKLEELPIQTIGVLFGGVITALITYFLLLGQTQAEENKERNVKVFEEKSTRFNKFINKLWAIWDDREVDLEELNELIKLVSQDIILYSKPETVDKILSNLIVIADQAKPDKSNRKDTEATKLIQQSIFDIINELAKEIGLGGEIKPEIRQKLNQLEEKVVPFLMQKDFKKNYFQSLKETFDNSEDEINITNIEYKDKLLWCQVSDSNVYFRIGPLERELNKGGQIGAYVEYKYRNYQKFRDAVRGIRKDYLRDMRVWEENLVNFNDYDAIQKMFHSQNKENEQGENNNKLANKIIHLYKTWKIDGKNIDQIIEECSTSS